MFYFRQSTTIKCIHSCIGSVMVCVLASSAVDPRFEFRSDQTKDYKIGMCCFSSEHAPLRRKSKDWLAQNQDNVLTNVTGNAIIRRNGGRWV